MVKELKGNSGIVGNGKDISFAEIDGSDFLSVDEIKELTESDNFSQAFKLAFWAKLNTKDVPGEIAKQVNKCATELEFSLRILNEIASADSIPAKLFVANGNDIDYCWPTEKNGFLPYTPENAAFVMQKEEPNIFILTRIFSMDEMYNRQRGEPLKVISRSAIAANINTMSEIKKMFDETGRLPESAIQLSAASNVKKDDLEIPGQ